MPRLRIRPLPALAAAAALMLTLNLGNWQMRRADEKLALQALADERAGAAPVAIGVAAVDAAALERRRVVLRGEWLPAKAVFLDNRQRRGVVGYHLLMPLRIEGGARHVLVNRGWIAAGRSRDELPAVTTPAGEALVAGEARGALPRYLDMGRGAPAGPVWQNLSLDDYRAWSGLDLQPLVVLQTNEAGDGLVREWDRPDFGVDRHRGYAAQWYGLAALVAVLFVVLTLRRGKADEA